MKMNDFVLNVHCEPPKFYFDELERSRIVEFVAYKTVLRTTENLNGGREQENERIKNF